MSIQELIASQAHLAFQHGVRHEQERNVALAKSLICFDNLEGTGCEHSVCFMLTELIEKIQA
jgi:hypothetical protein